MSGAEPRPGPSSAAILRASDVATGVFVVIALASAVDLRALKGVIVVVSGLWFLAGCIGYAWAFAIAVDRSRESEIGLGGLFFLLGSAPRNVQVRLMGAFAVQVVVGVATAVARPFTSQAFAVLAPMFGLGVMGLWGARFGTFPPRTTEG
jgi:hypothetical protein